MKITAAKLAKSAAAQKAFEVAQKAFEAAPTSLAAKVARDRALAALKAARA